MDAMRATKLASEELQKPISDSKQSAFSFLTGGQIFSIFRDRLRRFASDGTYSERLVRVVEQRQADLQYLQGSTTTICKRRHIFGAPRQSSGAASGRSSVSSGIDYDDLQATAHIRSASSE